MNNRYKVLRQLGRGGFGAVFLAHDSATNQDVAIKQLLFDQPDTRQRFEREVRMLLRHVDNRYVVEIREHDLDHDPPYLVLEYCEHGSLRTWVGKNRGWRDIASALAHAVQGLHGIHEAGGFHRDIKPDNLLIASNPADGGKTVIIKVADFGLARSPVTSTNIPMTRTACGTEGYIAPEVLAGKPFTSAADVYSLGVVSAELINGDRTGSSLGQAVIPDRMRNLIRAMLSADPRKRPNANGIAAELNVILTHPMDAKVEDGSSGLGWIFGGLLAGGALIALAALASGDVKAWNEEVRRDPPEPPVG